MNNELKLKEKQIKELKKLVRVCSNCEYNKIICMSRSGSCKYCTNGENFKPMNEKINQLLKV